MVAIDTSERAHVIDVRSEEELEVSLFYDLSKSIMLVCSCLFLRGGCWSDFM